MYFIQNKLEGTPAELQTHVQAKLALVFELKPESVIKASKESGELAA